MPLYYPRNALTASTYDSIYNQLVTVFPAIAVNYGKPIAYRWRCITCGPREYETNTRTLRLAGGVDGPIAAGWDYRIGGSYARSASESLLGSGYAYRGIFSSPQRAAASGVAGAVSGGIDPRAPTAPGASAPGIVGLLNSGILNPFSVVQTPEALAALDAVSAKGVTLYSGRYEVLQFDASVSGQLFDLPGGTVSLAFGVDYRRETYSFNGSSSFGVSPPEIFNVADDNDRALSPRNRYVKAAYAELAVPLFNELELTFAGRIDDYSGFGSTFNPKISGKFEPVEGVMLRASYNTGFRVPQFNQVFNPSQQTANPGSTLVDYTKCSGRVVNPAIPGCEAITPDTLIGGNPKLGPETSEQYSVGLVLRPARYFSASLDFWSIAVDDTIGSLTITQLLDNASFFPERIFRDSAGIINLLDLRTANIGSRRTQGLEVVVRGGFDGLGGTFTAGLDGTYLVKKREKLLPNAPYSSSLIGVFTFTGDLGLRWKHNAFLNWSNGTTSVSFSQIYRDGYKNYALPGIANGSVTRPGYNPRVDSYALYNLSISHRIEDGFRLTAGVRNVFDTDPPYAITYDTNFGSGSSWEPRVADPRGRSFTIAAEMKF